MNRAERRRKDRQDKKVIKQEGDTQTFQMEMELLQPWSNFVLGFFAMVAVPSLSSYGWVI